MPFRLRRDTRTWFKDIRPSFTLDFDMYHLCLVTGLVVGRKEDVPTEDTTVLVDHFPGDYKAYGRVVVGLFLTVELESLGVATSERKTMHSTISQFIDPSAPSHLSDTGMQEMNKYSFGGFDTLTEWFDARPRTFETFFPIYKRQLDQEIARTGFASW